MTDALPIPDVNVIVPFTIGHCGLFEDTEEHKFQLLRDWVGLAVTDGVLMVAAVLLSSCRYILKIQPDNIHIGRLALQYKQTSLQTLRADMTDKSAPFHLATIAKALALAIDEVWFALKIAWPFIELRQACSLLFRSSQETLPLRKDTWKE
jgi:hypothetical protein